MKKKNEKGVTLIILVIMIIVMLIIAGITIYNGNDAIKKANLENLKTNLLLIQAKTKEYVEEVSFRMGTKPDETKRNSVREEVYQNEGKLIALSNASEEVKSAATVAGINPNDTCYYVSREALNNLGLNQVPEGKGDYYIVKFDETNLTVEIYNTKGFSDKGILKYSLTDIDNINK